MTLQENISRIRSMMGLREETEIKNIDMDIFSKMKVYFSSMSVESRESVWKYSQNISRLAKACYSA